LMGMPWSEVKMMMIIPRMIREGLYYLIELER